MSDASFGETTTGVESVDTGSAGTGVVAAIRSAIVEGKIAPGERLREDRLAAGLGVSRTPVREALRVLEAEGYVESTPYAGARVRAFEPHDVEAAHQARALLEGLAARRAATRATDEQIDALQESCRRYEALGPVTAANVDDVAAENHAFHGIIFEASGSELVTETIVKLSELPRSVSIGIGVGSGQGKLISEHDHRQLTRAIAARDPDWAAALAEAHVLEIRDHVMRFLASQQPAPEQASA